MDPINQQPTSTPTPQPAPVMPQMPTENKPWGPVIGIVVILILLVLAAVYVWGQKQNNEIKNAPAPVSVKVNADTVAAQEKDDFSDLEANLDSAVEGLDDLSF